MIRPTQRATVAFIVLGLLAARAVVPTCVRAQPACTSGASCDDGNPCTDDLCDATLGCLHAPNSTACNDANACTTTDVCAAGGCIGGPPASGCTSCAAAATIPASGGTFVGVTTGSSTLAGSCASTTASPERVYRWTPASSGVARVETCGSATTFDTVIYLGQGACSGAELTCNDDTVSCSTGEPSTYHGSRLAPTVTAGTTYYIVVDGWSGAHGAYTLTVIPPNTCGNGVREGQEQCDGTDAAACGGGQCTPACTCAAPGLPDLIPEIADVSIEQNATVASGDVAEGCAESTAGVDLLRFTARTRNASSADMVLGDPLCPSPCSDHPLEVCANPDFLCSPAAGHNHPHYTNYARYELLDATNQAVVVGHKQGYCLRDSICDAPKYTCTNQGITAGCADEYGAGLGCQYVDITATPPGTYTLRVTLDPYGKIPEVSESTNIATVTVTIPPPGTTTTTLPGGCAAPSVVPPAGGVFQGVTSGTGLLTGCVNETGPAPEQVFQWTPAVSGQAILETCAAATSYDTVLYVRSGSCTTGSQVACNDDTSTCATADGCATYHGSRVTMAVTAGVPYFVVVDGYSGSCGGDRGSFQLTVVAPTTTTTTTSSTTTTSTTTSTTSTTTTTRPTTTTTTSTTTTTRPTTSTTLPAACVASTVIPASGGTFLGTTAGANSLTGACGSTAASPEVVYQWTPSTSGTAKINTCSSRTKFSTVVYVRRGDCRTGSDIACNQGACDASGSARGSRISVSVRSGEKYFIVVDGNAGGAGAFKLEVNPP